MIELVRDGLTQLHPQAEDPRSPPTVDIIFVHGLRGHPRTTWESRFPQIGPTKVPPTMELPIRPAKKRHRFPFFKSSKEPEPGINGSCSAESSTTSSARKVFWPAEQAPSKLPGARLWTYGYNADVLGGLFEANNKNSIRQHGNDFMVKMERKVRGDAPIFFVAHSLGGLVVKSAISRMQSSRDSSFEACYSRIGGVIFCGTPHRGSDAAGWGVLASRMVTMALMDSNTKLLSDLSIDSETLDVIQEDFLNVLSLSPGNIRIHSFQEGRALSGVKGFHEKVVHDFSSKLGWPSERFETIDADHREMIREPGMRDILDVLKDMETEALEKIEQRERTAQRLSNVDEGEATDAKPYKHLSAFNKIHRDEMRLRVSQPQPGTCVWLMEQQAIKKWRSTEGLNLVWLCGHPGFGKSVLARYLVDKLSETTDSSMTVFFFCSYTDDRTQDLATLLSALIHQLIFDDPRLSRPIEKKYGVISDSIANSLLDLWEILTLVVNSPRRRKIFLVIDALDELARSSWHELLENLTSIVNVGNGSVKLFITSRHEPEIGQFLDGRSARIDLGRIAQNRSDVEKYLQDTVKKYGSSRSFGDDRIKIVVDEMVSRADGMFLWAKLAWKYFIDGVGLWTKSTLDRKITDLRQLPPGLDALYHRILTKIDKCYWHDIMHVLSWMAVVRRPLTIKELPTALALRERPRAIGKMELGFNVPQFLESYLPNLIEVHDNGNITALHQSFKEFLTETTELFETKEKNLFFIDKHSANYEAGLSCLWYLGLDDYNNDELLHSKILCSMEHGPLMFDSNDLLLYRYPFLQYSMDHWASHLAFSKKEHYDRNPASLTMSLDDHLDDDQVVWNYFERTLLHDCGARDKLPSVLHKRMQWAPTEPAIFTLFHSKLWGLLKQASLHGFDMNESGSPNFLSGHRFLRPASSDNDTLVHMAFDENDLDAMSYILSLGGDVNARGWRGRTLLHLLVIRQTPDDIKTWLAYPGVDVNARDDDGETPLHFAARTHENTEVILEILLGTPGIDVNLNNSGNCALIAATRCGKFNATRRLLEVPAMKLGHSTHPYQTESAFINSATQGWSEIVIDILNALRDIDQFRDRDNRTILHWTIIQNLHRAFEITLDKQTHILNSPDIKGMTPLHYAADYGLVSMVDSLIRHGASPSARNKIDETPLHLACRHAHMAIARLLLNQTPINVVNARDISGCTPMHRAMTSGNDDLVEWLSSQATVNVDVREKHGRLPIHFAAAYASTTVLQSFSRRFPSQVCATDDFGYTLFHMAVTGDNRMNILYLLHHFPYMDYNAQNMWGKQPLDYARYKSIKDMLLENGFRHSKIQVKQLNRLYAHLVDSGSDARPQQPGWELVLHQEPKACQTEKDVRGEHLEVKNGKRRNMDVEVRKAKRRKRDIRKMDIETWAIMTGRHVRGQPRRRARSS